MIKVEVQEIQVPIHTPFQSFGSPLTQRQSLLWTISDHKHSVTSEQCFYPGLIPLISKDEIKHCQSQLLLLETLLEQVKNAQSMKDLFYLPWFLEFEKKLHAHHLFAPQFLALQWIWLKTKHQSLAHLFQKQTLQLSGLITNLKNDHDLTALTRWKVKIAREPFEIESKALEAYIHRYPNHQFRLDANDQLKNESLVQWIKWCESHHEKIEYIESPCQDRREWNQLSSRTPLAYDLRILDDLHEILEWKNLSALIVKPSLLSCKGVYELSEWVVAKKLRTPIILSSCFELPQGLNQIARMSSFCPPFENSLYHGLATSSWVDSNAVLSSTIKLDSIESN